MPDSNDVTSIISSVVQFLYGVVRCVSSISTLMMIPSPIIFLFALQDDRVSGGTIIFINIKRWPHLYHVHWFDILKDIHFKEYEDDYVLFMSGSDP